MRVLLDSNVWRYVTDENAAGRLQTIASRRRLRIVVAPPVLYEALRMRNVQLRRRLAEAMTRPAWVRMMPDAYAEAEEFKQEVRRLRPAWMRQPPDMVLFKRLRSDWQKRSGGFWSRARTSPELEHEALKTLDGDMMERARHDARTQRQQTVTDQFGSALAIPLNTIVGRPATPVDGWDGQPVDMWRISTWGFITQALTDASSAHCDWSAGEIDIQLALFQRADWTRFWLYEVEASRMPHFWLRAAFEYLQSFHKVTDGTPADSQIGSYAADTDLIVSADRRFIDMCLRCKREAPFDVADATVVGGGSTGVEELFQILEGM